MEIEIEVSLSECLLKAPVQDVIEHYQKYHQISELTAQMLISLTKEQLNELLDDLASNCFDADEVIIKALGGIDQVLEDHEGAVREWFKNLNATHEDDAKARD